MENYKDFLEKTAKSKERFDELTTLVMDPNVIADNKAWKKLVKERSAIEDLANAYVTLKNLTENLSKCESDVKSETDAEMKKLYEAEIDDLKNKIDEEVENIKILLLPKDENDESNAILEIRAAAGGEESALFGMELLRMYSHYADKNRWKTEILDINETELGGVKECTVLFRGKGAYSKLKYESGVHRVQRVPETESGGRIHTSTATVAVLPEVEDIDFEIKESDLKIDTYRSGGAGGQHVNKTIDFEIKESDLKIDTYRSGGAGGQHVNKTESAIRITHLPTGMIVTCQDERSQLKNKEKAMNILKSKLYDYYREQRDSEYDENRKSQVGRGNRNERIRTYNYPQGRVTDHRTNLSSYDLEGVLNGDIDQFIEAMVIKEREEMLAKL